MTTLRLNLGCGLQSAPGWVNIDRSPTMLIDKLPMPVKLGLKQVGVLKRDHLTPWPKDVKRENVLKTFRYGDGTVDAIYSSHMLEHLYFTEAQHVLRECHRVLRSGGVLRLALPNADQMLRDFVSASPEAKPAAARVYVEHMHAHPLSPPTRRQRLLAPVAGAPHRWQPHADLVMAMLQEAGFNDKRETEYLRGKLPDIAAVEHRADSLFVEAIR